MNYLYVNCNEIHKFFGEKYIKKQVNYKNTNCLDSKNNPIKYV